MGFLKELQRAVKPQHVAKTGHNHIKGARESTEKRGKDPSFKANGVKKAPKQDLGWLDELEFFDAIFDDG